MVITKQTKSEKEPVVTQPPGTGPTTPQEIAAAMEQKAQGYLPDMSQERIERLCTEICKTKLGRRLFEMASWQFGEITCQFDIQIDGALGSAWNYGPGQRKFIFLSPWLSDNKLQCTLVHELAHTLQVGDLFGGSPLYKASENLFITRMKEGEAFLLQTLFALDKYKECGDGAPLRENRYCMARRIPGATGDQFEELCRSYFFAEDKEQRRTAIADLFWTIQKGGLGDYDETAMRHFRELGWAQMHTNLWRQYNGLGPCRQKSRQDYYYGQSLPLVSGAVFCGSTVEPGSGPCFLSPYTTEEIIRKFEACLSPEIKAQRDREEGKIRALLVGLSSGNVPFPLSRQAERFTKAPAASGCVIM
jgi:hypothetical protein